jgi:hypothetical protein
MVVILVVIGMEFFLMRGEKMIFFVYFINFWVSLGEDKVGDRRVTNGVSLILRELIQKLICSCFRVVIFIVIFFIFICWGCVRYNLYLDRLVDIFMVDIIFSLCYQIGIGWNE